MKLCPILVVVFVGACGGSRSSLEGGALDAGADALSDVASDQTAAAGDTRGDLRSMNVPVGDGLDAFADLSSDSPASDLAGPAGPDVAAVVDVPPAATEVGLPADAGDAAPPVDGTTGDISPPADAGSVAPLHTDTRLLAVSRNTIFELNRVGQVLQQRPIPSADAIFFDVKGAAITGRLAIHIGVSFLNAAANATAAGIMTLDLVSGTHEIASAPGYRTAGLEGAFGIATAAGHVFTGTFSDSSLFRFDVVHRVYRTVPGTDANHYTVDVSRGLDGRIYQLTSGLVLMGYDPQTLVKTGETTLVYNPSGIPIRGVAVDSDGKVFAAAESGQMLRYSSTGQLELTTTVTGVYRFEDVDIDAEGRVLFGGDRGQLVITDRALATQQPIQLPTTDSAEIVVVD